MYKRHESNATAASLEKVLQSHLFHDILERTNWGGAEAGRKVTHRISHHHGKLFEAQLAIAVLVGLHNRLIDDLLELCILIGWGSSFVEHTNREKTLKRTFKLLPTIIFSTRNNSPLEMKPSRSISYTLKATTPKWDEHEAA